jgi:hypothetical protein
MDKQTCRVLQPGGDPDAGFRTIFHRLCRVDERIDHRLLPLDQAPLERGQAIRQALLHPETLDLFVNKPGGGFDYPVHVHLLVEPALVPAGKRLQVPDDVADGARVVEIFLKPGSHLATHTE